MTKTPIAEVVFEDPPDLPRYDWVAIAEQVKARPGEWAKVFDFDRVSLAESIRNQGIAALRGTEFEVKTRNSAMHTEPGTGKKIRYCTLYLRYVPPTPEKKAKKR